MKRLERFGEYLYELLPAALRKGVQTVNQFYIFFHVMGTVFDDTKQDIFRVRRESMVSTASEEMLPEHGRERDMPRLEGETTESYRARLLMKGELASKAGSTEGIRLVLISFGADGDVIPYYTIDPERWAEFLVRIRYDLDGIYVGLAAIRKEVRKVKQASSRDNYEVVMMGRIPAETSVAAGIRMYMEYYPRQNLKPLRLDGTWKLDGTRKLNGYQTDSQVDFYPLGIRIPMRLAASVSVSIPATRTRGDVADPVEHRNRLRLTMNTEAEGGGAAALHLSPAVKAAPGLAAEVYNGRKLDGTWKLDGSRKLNGGWAEL